MTLLLSSPKCKTTGKDCSRRLPRSLLSTSLSFPTGLVDSEVTQTPKFLTKSRKQQVTLRCSPESGHRSVYWFAQALGQGPQFLVQYFDGEVYQRGNMSDRFSGQQLGDSRSELNLTSLELMDSALYLCASSPDTALHDQVPLEQKLSCPSSGSGGERVGCQCAKLSLWKSNRFSQTFIS